jgi:hypothetical protein
VARKRSRFSFATRTNDCEGMAASPASGKVKMGQHKANPKTWVMVLLPFSSRISIVIFPGIESDKVPLSWTAPLGRDEGVFAFSSFR